MDQDDAAAAAARIDGDGEERGTGFQLCEKGSLESQWLPGGGRGQCGDSRDGEVVATAMLENRMKEGSQSATLEEGENGTNFPLQGRRRIFLKKCFLERS